MFEMPGDRGVKRSTTNVYGSRKRSRLAQLKSAREKQQKSTNFAGVVVSESYTEMGEIELCTGAGYQQTGNVGAVIQPPLPPPPPTRFRRTSAPLSSNPPLHPRRRKSST